MGTDETDVDDTGVVVNFDDQPVLIAFDVEHNAVAWQDIGAVIANANILRVSPLRMLCFCVPGPERLLGVVVPVPELAEGADGITLEPRR